MARLIRTEKEVEGEYEEQWIVVEEDALDQWPAGPLEVVGRPAPRVDGHERARGEARTPPTSSCRACCTRPCCAARTRMRASRSLDLAARARGARRARRDRPRRPPRRCVRESGFAGAAVAAVAADTVAQAHAALELIDVEWEVLEPLLDPDDAVARGRSFQRADALRARRHRARARRGRRRRRGRVPHADRPAQLAGDAQAVCAWDGDDAEVYTSTQYIWGVRAARRRAARHPAGQGAGRLRVHGRRLRLEERPRRLHLRRRRARHAHGPTGPLRAHPPRGEPRARATATRRSSA